MSEPGGVDLGTPETAVAHRIADMIDHLGGSVNEGSVDDSVWDFASIARIGASTRWAICRHDLRAMATGIRLHTCTQIIIDRSSVDRDARAGDHIWGGDAAVVTEAAEFDGP